MADAKISALPAASAAAGANEIPINEAGTTKKVTLTQVDTLFGIASGWISLGACTYEGADAPSYTVSFASDMTGILSAGMRFKCTDSTVKYFIITAVGAFSGGKTIITIYGGTDYTQSGGAISAPYYSIQKAPFGFPLSPAKWTVEVIDTSLRNQDNAVAATWYNLGSVGITVPIGVWNLHYFVSIAAYMATTNASRDISVTLSTANNSQSYNYMTAIATCNSTGGHVDYSTYMVSRVAPSYTVAAKTALYLNTSTTSGGAGVSIYNRGDQQNTYIRAISCYL